LSCFASTADSWDHVNVGCSSAPCHYVTVTDKGRVNPSACPNGLCVFECLKNNTDWLSGRRRPDYIPRSCKCTPTYVAYDPAWPQNYARYPTLCELALIIHYVGDMHQPMHSSWAANNDVGGNSICVDLTKPFRALQSQSPLVEPNANTVYGKGAKTDPRARYARNDVPCKKEPTAGPKPPRCKYGNLHALWDSGMIRALMGERQQDWPHIAEWLLRERRTLSSGSSTTYTSAADFEAWTQESYDASMSYNVRRGLTVQNSVQKGTLDLDYYESNKDLLIKRIVLAGMRLASVLTDVLSEARIDARNYKSLTCPPPVDVVGGDGGSIDPSRSCVSPPPRSSPVESIGRGADDDGAGETIVEPPAFAARMAADGGITVSFFST